jgi:hypothetical protein
VKLFRLKPFLISTAIVVVMAATAIAIYLSEPLPPPKVSIEFEGFKTEKNMVFHLQMETNDNGGISYRGRSKEQWWFSTRSSSTNFSLEQTNLCCGLYLTNCGSIIIWWISLDCRVEARTTNCWVTNYFSHFTLSPWSVSPSGKDEFGVYIPLNTIEWRVVGECSYFKHHNIILELACWLSDDFKRGSARPIPKMTEYSLRSLSWVSDLTSKLLPRPSELGLDIQSKLFTNRPPALILTTQKQP